MLELDLADDNRESPTRTERRERRPVSIALSPQGENDHDTHKGHFNFHLVNLFEKLSLQIDYHLRCEPSSFTCRWKE
ncbi:hypothetical protein TNIN_121941 [Trichonephila inaurata madagascariensis]|uniref:Uncharacterized protein n=1 Tax=Trichonephila inaurata madagascariensis TaxID=2747483 RepID=A0A8X6WRZ6_9ARAC|nr:hypothetical protein TNIN_121941 [Trichonephila inaurata madagascariensis]